jgi:hypothetical protein
VSPESNQCCGSGISDPTIATKEGGRGYVLPYLFMLVTSFTKFKTCFVCEKVSYRKKIVPFFKELQYFLAKKLSLSSQNWLGDPRCPFPDTGSRGQKGLGSRIRNTKSTDIEHYYEVFLR